MSSLAQQKSLPNGTTPEHEISHSTGRRSAPSAVAVWVLFAAFCNAAGWVLSAFHALNVWGYAAAFALAAAGVAYWSRRTESRILPRVNLVAIRRRFRRPFPLAFLVLALLAVLGGVIYAPNNYDALAYRVARVLHWLSADQWHWIHTEFQRLNTRGCGFEWVSAPLLLFTKTDRLLFLANAISFVLMPGLVFSIFTRLGVTRRVAWVWMWLLPTGYCYLLQAGGMGNDLFSAFFPLAAMHFALRAANRRSSGDAMLAIIAAGLTTAVKMSNIPLVLPVAVALLPCVRMLLSRPIATALALTLGLLASAVPTALLNARYCGDWSGAKAEHIEGMHSDRLLRVANNCALLLIQNLAPPLFPQAESWNNAVQKHMPAALHDRLAKGFEAGGADWSLAQFQWEVNAGLGTGLSVLLAAGFFARRRRSRARSRTSTSPMHPTVTERSPEMQQTEGLCHRRTGYQRLVLAAIVVAMLGYLAGMGLSAIGRVTAPYYPFAVGVCLLPGCQAVAVRRAWWRTLAWLSLLGALVLLCITPPRPLWPALTLLGRAGNSRSHLVAMARDTYAVNRLRPDALAPLRAMLPADATKIGMVTGDDPETSIWRPFGSRTVRHVTPSDSGTELRSEGIRYIVVSGHAFGESFKMPFEEWLATMGGEVTATVPLTLKAVVGPRPWYVVRLGDPPASKPR